MATVTSVTKHFPTAKEGFTTTLASTIASGAATVPLNSVTGYANGDTAVLVVEPGNATNKQVFTGVVDTAGVQLTGVVWTEGTNTTHNAGSTVVDYVAATHMSMVTKGLLVEHLQTGAHHDITSTNATITNLTATNLTLTGTATSEGWSPLGATPNTVTYNGNRSYDLVINGVDKTSVVSNGMRLKLTRTVTAPTQSTSLNGTTQYYSKASPAGMTFTDDFVASAWIKVSSYPSGDTAIISRYNGTSGWALRLQANGQIVLIGYNAGSSNVSYVLSYQSVPLNKWVHVAAQLDMSAFTATTTTSYVMIDGVDAPSSVIRAGTNPTALIQAGDLQVGAYNGAGFFPGKIAQVAIYSAKVTQANIKATMSQALAGTETSLISAYSFNNSITDLVTGNANNLTANGSAVATNADTPFSQGATGTTEYGIITANSFSTNTTLTVQVPEGSAIPTTGGVSAVSYSTQKVPYGFPSQRGKWAVECWNLADNTSGINVTYNHNLTLTVPIGDWLLGYQFDFAAINGTTGPGARVGISTSSSSLANKEFNGHLSHTASNNTVNAIIKIENPVSLAAATPYYTVSVSDNAGTQQSIRNASNGSASVVRAECAYV